MFLCGLYVRIIFVMKLGDFMGKYTETRLKYARENLKRIPLDVPLEMHEKWKKAAKMLDLPLNTLIKSAVNEKIDGLEINLDGMESAGKHDDTLL